MSTSCTEHHVVTTGSEFSFPVRFSHESVTKELADPKKMLAAVSAGHERDDDRYPVGASECWHIEDRCMKTLHHVSEKHNAN